MSAPTITRVVEDYCGRHDLQPGTHPENRWRDKTLREQGWLIFRVNAADSVDEDQLANVAALVNAELAEGGEDR